MHLKYKISRIFPIHWLCCFVFSSNSERLLQGKLMHYVQ